MPPTVSDDKTKPGRSNWRPLVLDLLKEPLQENFGIQRDGNDFVVHEPWALARFGQVTLRRGWWTFECEGEGDVDAVELRLFSPEDGLLAFSLRRSAVGKVLFYTDRSFDVSSLVSAWPSRLLLKTLRLKRISKIEEFKLVGAMASRLIKSDRPLTKLIHVASRVFGGRSLRVQSQAVTRPQEGVWTENTKQEGLRIITHGGVSVALGEEERLHSRALEIVSDAFARSPDLRAALADIDEGGTILPRPSWDEELMPYLDRVATPIFFRGVVGASDVQTRLQDLSKQPEAIARIALPLARRDVALKRKFSSPPVPKLSHMPQVSVVIPTKIKVDLLERCLAGLADFTDYRNLDVIVIDNGVDDPRFADIISAASQRLSLQTVRDIGPFNFSRLVNLGVKATIGEIILLLNDDIEAIEPGWLHRLVESAASSSVGCVGARLLYPNRSIQHAGIMLGLSGVCGHLWKGMNESDASYIPQIVLPSSRMAVTGACLAIRRDLFDRAGGLDETNFPVSYNDVDFCLRVNKLGFRTVYRGDATLVHHESQSRGPDDATLQRRKRLAKETAAFVERWGHLLHNDPFGSPAFDPTVESGAIHPSLRES